MSEEQPAGKSGVRELWGIILITSGLLAGLALGSYQWADISLLNVPANDPPMNFIGPAGAWFAFVSLMLLGLGALLLPVWLVMTGLLLLFRPHQPILRRLAGSLLMILMFAGLVTLHSGWSGKFCERCNIAGIAGGLFGWLTAEQWLAALLGRTGATVLLAGLLAAAGVIFIGKHRLVYCARLCAAVGLSLKARIAAGIEARRDKLDEIAREEREIARQRIAIERAVRREQRSRNDTEQPPPVAPPPADKPPREKPEPKAAAAPAKAVKAAAAPSVYQLPPISVLPPILDREKKIKCDYEMTAEILRRTLADFSIETEVKNYETGPTVTRYELLPAPGVKLERIAALSNNLALTLKATSVRVQAPIPGKGLVGIEVPNTVSALVYLRDILEGGQWLAAQNTVAIPLVLGKDVSGKDIIADLDAMPHLLIAGATGSGKTVCMNSILVGMLMSRTPDQLRLILVDPKRVEFSAYAGLPHLVVPVITDPKKVPLGLRWAINEMEKRYKFFARAGVRDILHFNTRPETNLLPPTDEEEEPLPAHMAHIVIVVDELADLMLVARAEIENSIARLAQMSRAVGIHMILATQRPSVNVITGTIKANFPGRISFQVAQKVDSRTILDTIGADKLLGCGDMLFVPPGTSKLVRVQGAMTTDNDIHAIVDFWKKQGEPHYEVAIKERIESAAPDALLDEEGDDEELIQAAIQIIRETRRASVSMLQRRMSIGYNRAGRLMDVIEKRGIVGPDLGLGKREILIDLDGEIPPNIEDSDEKGENA